MDQHINDVCISITHHMTPAGTPEGNSLKKNFLTKKLIAPPNLHPRGCQLGQGGQRGAKWGGLGTLELIC